MISLILPYWNRREAATKALDSIREHYADILASGRLEVVIVDDGSTEPLDCEAEGFRTIHMPVKVGPLSPVTPWNVGAKEARGDLLALSCVEILHINPVLEEMAAQLEELGPKGYVMAAAWCPEMKEWHCHTIGRSSGAPEMPEGFGRSFLSMLRKDLYMEVGGFDEVFRDGAGWEDLDFAIRLKNAGAVPLIRDDLIVIHPKTGAKTVWPHGAFARNKAIYQQRHHA